jgi:hypothetical protein
MDIVAEVIIALVYGFTLAIIFVLLYDSLPGATGLVIA